MNLVFKNFYIFNIYNYKDMKMLLYYNKVHHSLRNYLLHINNYNVIHIVYLLNENISENQTC